MYAKPKATVGGNGSHNMGLCLELVLVAVSLQGVSIGCRKSVNRPVSLQIGVLLLLLLLRETRTSCMQSLKLQLEEMGHITWVFV